MEVTDFSEIQEEFDARVRAMIYCNLATVDRQMRPRSRIVHPVWEGEIGWVTSRRDAHKARHLESNPHVSVAYTGDLVKPVYVDCVAAWEDDPGEKVRVWDYIKAIPAPYGFDPVTVFSSLDDPKYGLLKLMPWRIELPTMPTSTLIWRSPVEQSA